MTLLRSRDGRFFDIGDAHLAAFATPRGEVARHLRGAPPPCVVVQIVSDGSTSGRRHGGVAPEDDEIHPYGWNMQVPVRKGSPPWGNGWTNW